MGQSAPSIVRPSIPENDPTAGLETLEDPRDRSLLESRELAVWRGPRQESRTSALTLLSAGVKARLGESWTTEGGDDLLGAVVLAGPSVHLADGDRAAAVRTLIASLPAPFGPTASASLEPVGTTPSGSGRSVRLVQILEGARVAGGVVIAHFDPRGDLRSLESSYKPGLQTFNTRILSRDEALRIAWADLQSAEPFVQRSGPPGIEAWVWPVDSGFAHVWTVHQTTRHPWGSFVTRVDAASGRVLSRESAQQDAIRTGEALVFRENSDYPGQASVRRLRNLWGRARNPDAGLRGAHFRIVDDRQNPVQSSVFRYMYHPFNSPDSFDQVAAYYHLERARARFADELGVHGLPWFDDGHPVSATVNAGGLCGAFYASNADEGSPGFVFGDQATCDFQNEDFARDADVIYHEFTHAVLDWKGLTLAVAPLDSYQRAISEADADYHSGSFTGDPVIGDVVGLTRNLDNDNVYPEDVPCDGGYMEEHCTGEIWAGLLWNLRSMLGQVAETLEFASLDHLVDRWPDGQVETWLDFWDATLALMRADEDLHEGAHLSLIYGAAASRGLFGPGAYGKDHVTPVYQRLRAGTKLKSIGWVLKPLGRVRYYFEAPAGREVSVKVRTTSSLEPAFVLGDLEAGDVKPFARSTVQTPTTVSLETTLRPTRTIYVLEVYGVAASTGTFQVSVSVR